MFPKPEEWTPGIYFGLPEKLYHSLPWCGSGDIKTLYSSPPDYWHSSHMNPLREVEEESFARTFGKAIHDRILYGVETFQKNYRFIAGEKGDSPSAESLKGWIVEQGGRPAKLKADNERMVAEDFGVRLLSEKTYNQVMVAASMIVKNPNLAQAFTGGYPEVSVFWHENDVPCKARFDYLKSRAIVDLKSFRSKDRIRTMDEWVLQDLFNYRYDIQVAHYINGHKAAKELAAAGKVFVGLDTAAPAPEWLAKTLEKPPGWVFVFYKADGMPISKSYQIPFESPAHQSGAYAVKLAIDNYRDNLERFGTDAWVNMDPPYNLDDEDIPKWL